MRIPRAAPLGPVHGVSEASRHAQSGFGDLSGASTGAQWCFEEPSDVSPCVSVVVRKIFRGVTECPVVILKIHRCATGHPVLARKIHRGVTGRVGATRAAREPPSAGAWGGRRGGRRGGAKAQRPRRGARGACWRRRVPTTDRRSGEAWLGERAVRLTARWGARPRLAPRASGAAARPSPGERRGRRRSADGAVGQGSASSLRAG